ncbi:MAG: TusE/DsrC/DsvC family sulfur relay protein [Nitrospirae bacterium]|nr:MAG: TusE/DsrC/DsvC family sulfur relay protein [Nitrospirota bacterium]
MRTIEYKGIEIKLDDDGYLLNSDDWNEGVACALAETENVEELTKDRMDIIKFMREYYKVHNAFPILRAVCKNVRQSKDCFSEKFIDPLKAWKIAGLPKPDVHVIADIRGEGGVV